MRRHQIQFHMYADDTQMYLTFKAKVSGAAETAKCSLETCVEEIRQWMSSNLLKLNDEKSEMLVISSRFSPPVSFPSLKIGDEEIETNTSVRNIGVQFDTGMSMVGHVGNVSRASFGEIRKLGSIRKFLTDDSTEILVHAFITSRVDYCNSLLIGLPKYLINRLQMVQNTAARVAKRVRKYDHITPVLFNLHWLPVEQRIQFKVLLTIYKVLHGIAPEYLQELVSRDMSVRRVEELVLKVPHTKMVNYGDRAFSVAGPELWNNLPVYIHTSHNVNTFKSKLKNYLFQIYYTKLGLSDDVKCL